MGKRIKLYEEFVASPQTAPERVKPETKPTTKPNKPQEKPSRPGPIRKIEPAISPTPKATADDVVDHFGAELDNLSEEEKVDYLKTFKTKYKG